MKTTFCKHLAIKNLALLSLVLASGFHSAFASGGKKPPVHTQPPPVQPQPQPHLPGVFSEAEVKKIGFTCFKGGRYDNVSSSFKNGSYFLASLFHPALSELRQDWLDKDAVAEAKFEQAENKEASGAVETTLIKSGSLSAIWNDEYEGVKLTVSLNMNSDDTYVVNYSEAYAHGQIQRDDRIFAQLEVRAPLPYLWWKYRTATPTYDQFGNQVSDTITYSNPYVQIPKVDNLSKVPLYNVDTGKVAAFTLDYAAYAKCLADQSGATTQIRSH